MKITCIADLHGARPSLLGGDLLIVAGDCTKSDSLVQWGDFFTWLEDQPYRKKVLIGGNHDNYLVDKLFYSKKSRRKFEYLCDSGTDFEDLSIWGSPWTFAFDGINPHCKAFTVSTELEISEKFDLIPEKTDILITHSPAYGILDLNKKWIRCGSIILKKTINSIKPKLHVFGHIHEARGISKRAPGIISVNCSIMNEDYEPVNDPYYFEYKGRKIIEEPRQRELSEIR
jgi:Icc-related predicted phosphoesterase